MEIDREPMVSSASMAAPFWGGAAIAMMLALTCDIATAQTPRPSPKSSVANPAAIDVLRQRDQELESVRAEQRKAIEAEQRLAVENDALAEERRKLNQSVIDTAARVRSSEEDIAATEIRLRQLDASEAEIHRALDRRRALIAEVLAALQRMSRHSPPAIFVGADDAVESVRTVMSLGAVLPDMRGETDKLVIALTDLARVRKEKAIERDQLSSRLADLADAQHSLASLIEERQKRQAEIEQAIGTERQRTLALSRQADNLKDLIGKLEQGLDSSSRAVRLAARPSDDSRSAAELRSGLALSDPARMAPAVAFVSAKGKLRLPVSGVKTREFGVADGVGGNEKGISIATRAGAQVTAPSDGWVVYAAPYRSYGQLLILNVGGGYHILLAGMERMTVDLGQFVLTGEPVAVMGGGTQIASAAGTGPSSAIGPSQPVLYIEFRKDGTPVDPTPWWAATENEKGRG